ncbi:hypothetical protein [Polymorphobacter megasporae]|uniref:hypothetical protein n=1 Tax=Glacieibacterium megasporae TaxID=2835787 RepID=UPI001C1E1B59|nr:hypothetical protein [Polymorphobacter megasporae]UAJ12352.1 hypothetical protein KTC28_21280 [Polymorphobacter megasporae]
MPIVLEDALGGAIVSLPVEPGIPVELAVPVDTVLTELLIAPGPVELVLAEEPPDDGAVCADAAIAINMGQAVTAIRSFMVGFL